jgi:pimeloyl-ACP methyl ester carboxylesterase
MLVEVEPGVVLHVDDWHVEDWQVEDHGSGRPVVLIAGFGLNSEAWQGQVEPLTAHGYRVIALDVRGTGRSTKPLQGYDIDRLVSDVVAVLDALQLPRAAVVGWSFGGQIGMRLAVREPSRVSALIMVGSNGARASRSEEYPFGPDGTDLEARLVHLERTKRIATRRRTIASAFAGEPDPDVVGWLLRMQLQMPSWAAIASYPTYLHTDLIADLSTLKLPVRQIMGAADPVSPIEGAAWLQERLPDGQLITLDCGHYPMLEVPAAFDEALLRSLTSW